MKKIFDYFHDIEKDKLQHFVSGLLLYVLCAAVFASNGVPLFFAVFSVLIAGLTKEAYDYLYNRFVAKIHTPDAWDAAATFAGGLSGWICSCFCL